MASWRCWLASSRGKVYIRFERRSSSINEKSRYISFYESSSRRRSRLAGMAQFVGAPPRRREAWLRQLMRKWGSLSNTGSSGFNRDDIQEHNNDNNDTAFDFEDDLKDGLDENLTELEKNEQSISTDLRASTNKSLLRGQSETLRQQFIDHHQYRVAVHTWNVAGKPPPDDLDLEGWIKSSLPADVYVFGFQEVVPLNANNVLCVEDEGPAALWEAKIREALNRNSNKQPHESLTLKKSLSVPLSPRSDPVTDVPEVSDVERLLAELNSSASSSDDNLLTAEVILHDKNLAICEQRSKAQGKAQAKTLSEKESLTVDALCAWNDATTEAERLRQLYSRVASKQMVGLFITVWIRSHLWRHVHNVQVSTVGCGLMNHLGNKGSISVSMFLHYTSFCFVCSHLTSGHKDGDALRRNADVAEILRRTRFPRLAKLFGLGLPESILAHDRVMWLGDLNYRLALPDEEIWILVKQGDWANLLRMDQLKLEQGEGRVFSNWQEGPICFPPTYKYMKGSDQYYRTCDSASTHSPSSGSSKPSSSKPRSPAWCDRVLWYGEGLYQLEYSRELDSKLSDHRSVSATFLAEVEVVNRKKLKKACAYPVNHEEVDGCNNKVLPTVKPFVEIHKLQSNEIWSSLMKTLTPRRISS